jgi:hypothetical protein
MLFATTYWTDENNKFSQSANNKNQCDGDANRAEHLLTVRKASPIVKYAINRQGG